MNNKVAIVTGGNRGIGLETAKQLAEKGLIVILTARDSAKGKSLVDDFKKKKLDIHFHQLDVTKTESIAALIKFTEKEFGRLDVLVNNAGIFPDESWSTPILKTSVDTIREAMETNVYGAFQLSQLAVPLMKKNEYGRIVNVSSGMGQLNDMEGGSIAYRTSKTALNVLTRVLAKELAGENILVNSVCPGWVRTDMGGANAERPVEKGAETLVWLATLPDGATSGGFFRDKKPIEW
jgi:NAD(P)-dependent dehydrogenase (short-subunit alcohol dehydrogenase family)